MMLLVFPYSIDHFSFFHISVLIKPVLIFLYTIFFYSLFIRFFSHSDLKGFAKALTWLLICQLIFIGLQVVLGDHPVLMIFNHKEVETGFGVRAPGTFDWVYITCYFLSFYLIYQLLDLLMFKKAFSNLIILFFILIAIVLSQSKTGYLATLLICIYFFCFSIYAQIGIAKKLFIMFIAATVSLTSVVILLGIEFQYIEKFIELITEGRMDASTSTRKKQIILALSEGLSNWYSGSPLAFKGIIIENAYLDYLFRYGILGLLQYLFVLGFMITYSGWVACKVVNLYKLGKESQYAVKLAISAHLSMIAAALYSFTGTPIDAYKCAIWSSFIFSMVIFLNYRSYSLHTKKI